MNKNRSIDGEKEKKKKEKRNSPNFMMSIDSSNIMMYMCIRAFHTPSY